MRIILTALILAVGVLVGAAVPAVSGFVQGLLISAGLPPTVFNLASGPTAANSAEASPARRATPRATDTVTVTASRPVSPGPSRPKASMTTPRPKARKVMSK
ncbi:hypothetical protein GCM10025880_10830 [Methylorubrum aminovorans]|nr:hypothetical protein GCM10025880_10830 [Methylorubrum aminovorans]